MAFLERAVQAARQNAGNPASGQPNLSKNTAGPSSGLGTLTPSRPAASPVTPAINTAPPGRPATPVGLGGQVIDRLGGQVIDRAGSPSPYPKPPVLTSPSGMGPVRPTLPWSGSAGGLTASTPAPSPTSTLGGQVIDRILPPKQFTGMPRSVDIRNLQPGEQAMSPWGPVTLDEKGEPRVQFTPDGEIAYRKAVVVARKKFGPYPGSNDPTFPQPPIHPGQVHFNPQTGRWVEL